MGGFTKGGRRAAMLAVGVTGVTLALLLWSASRLLATAAPVPDHATVFSGTSGMAFAGQNRLAQRLIPRGDALRAIDFLIVAENPGLPGNVLVEVVSLPERTTLRQARVPAVSLPHGEIWSIRPGEPGERWTTFGFEPLAESAGRELLVVLSYAEGQDQPGRRLVTLAHFPGRYPDGELYVNGSPTDGRAGDLLFRASRSGTRAEAIGVALTNLARVQPFLRDSLALPVALGALALLCAGGAALVLSGPLR